MPEEWTNKIKLGLPGRDEKIDSWRRSIENLRAADVRSIIYFFSIRSSMGPDGLQPSQLTPGRGGTRGTAFDRDVIGKATAGYWEAPMAHAARLTDEQAWDNTPVSLKL